MLIKGLPQLHCITKILKYALKKNLLRVVLATTAIVTISQR